MTAVEIGGSVELARHIRRHALLMTSRGKASHIASGLSIADILAVLYAGVLDVSPDDPLRDDRDRLVISKGHAAAVVYAVLALRGFFPAERLDRYHGDGQPLGGHVTAHGVPGVELSTGALGHGLPFAVGTALSSARFGPAFRAFAILSDGECDEGSVWEAAMLAAHHRLGNLVVIVDYNKLQSLDTVARTLALEPFADKWRSFGWDVVEVDGHDHAQLLTALAPQVRVAAPRCVIAHTTKGKGVSFMENRVEWHYRSPSPEHLETALAELGFSA